MPSDLIYIPPHELFLPESYAEELLYFDVPLDADASTFKSMLSVNQAALDFCEGRLDTGTYLDMLDEFGIEPEEFLRNIEARVGL